MVMRGSRRLSKILTKKIQKLPRLTRSLRHLKRILRLNSYHIKWIIEKLEEIYRERLWCDLLRRSSCLLPWIVYLTLAPAGFGSRFSSVHRSKPVHTCSCLRSAIRDRGRSFRRVLNQFVGHGAAEDACGASAYRSCCWWLLSRGANQWVRGVAIRCLQVELDLTGFKLDCGLRSWAHDNWAMQSCMHSGHVVASLCWFVVEVEVLMASFNPAWEWASPPPTSQRKAPIGPPTKNDYACLGEDGASPSSNGEAALKRGRENLAAILGGLNSRKGTLFAFVLNGTSASEINNNQNVPTRNGNFISVRVNDAAYKEHLALCQFSLIARIVHSKEDKPWNYDDLYLKLQSIGIPLRIDNATLSGNFGRFAWVLVDVDLAGYSVARCHIIYRRASTMAKPSDKAAVTTEPNPIDSCDDLYDTFDDLDDELPLVEGGELQASVSQVQAQEGPPKEVVGSQ
ncbi:hypothetical protein FNV43_RR19403 [Rhamnella rubrinervis]|uniref:Uncharacterized protein n=1 Tax=Rhamnella rubrinervis TaxID=2594499 RepID=A0A8K0DTZ3_9ROSA|nr:hypothetical protein FNV43_RR19403 [Rhamnella rubrinervis]